MTQGGDGGHCCIGAFARRQLSHSRELLVGLLQLHPGEFLRRLLGVGSRW